MNKLGNFCYKLILLCYLIFSSNIYLHKYNKNRARCDYLKSFLALFRTTTTKHFKYSLSNTKEIKHMPFRSIQKVH